MNEPHADKWQQYFAPQVAARNRWAAQGAVHAPGRRRRPLRPRLASGLRRTYRVRVVAVSPET